jgi:hypothetical protein
VRLTKRYLRSVHAAAMAAAQAFREHEVPFLATILTPGKQPQDSTDLAALAGRVRAVVHLLKLNPSTNVLLSFDKLKELLKVE